jgi:hypothetical protein
MKKVKKGRNATNSKITGLLAQKKGRSAVTMKTSPLTPEEHYNMMTDIDVTEPVTPTMKEDNPITQAFCAAISDGIESVEDFYVAIKEACGQIENLAFKFKLLDDIKKAYKSSNAVFLPKSKLLKQLNVPAAQQTVLSRSEPITSDTLVSQLAQMQISLRKKTIRGKIQQGYALADFLEYFNQQQIDELPENLLR